MQVISLESCAGLVAQGCPPRALPYQDWALWLHLWSCSGVSWFSVQSASLHGVLSLHCITRVLAPGMSSCLCFGLSLHLLLAATPLSTERPAAVHLLHPDHVTSHAADNYSFSFCPTSTCFPSDFFRHLSSHLFLPGSAFSVDFNHDWLRQVLGKGQSWLKSDVVLCCG